MLEYSHNPLFVVASLAVALMAGFSGLSVTQGASRLGSFERKLVVTASAVILGWGIWSMHFVAMLDLQLPVLFYYDSLRTLISALSAILITGAALLVVHFGERTKTKIVIAGCILGLGIPVMHYTGMSGMELCRPVYTPMGIASAAMASIVLSVGSFLLCYGQRSARNILLGTFGFGLAVFAVHFVAMAGTQFQQVETETVAGPLISNDVLAFGVTLSAFVLSGVFLLTGATFAGKETADPTDTAEPAPQLSESEAAHPVEDEYTEPAIVTARFPYETNNTTHFIDAADVSAVRAEGHYTILYAGGDKLFCPWSITETEQRMGGFGFIRTHRSYLVNIPRVTSFERKKDTGVCYFEDTDAVTKVPVSRSRMNDVRAALGM